MLNKLAAWVRQMKMIEPGDRVICAVSGGADSVAMLFALYLLREKLGITVEAAHFNHCLRGEESKRDEEFVKSFCDRYDIGLYLGAEAVQAGEKGLEAAAREARYRFLLALPGKIATAHTADDNAETVLMHLIRGTGLKGLGGIAPVRGNLIRPMLSITRQEVEAFLAEWALDHVEDSTNAENTFLRNRIRHDILPAMARENPRIGENLSRMALRLRQDEAFIQSRCQTDALPGVDALRSMPPAQRSRVLERFLKNSGVKEPEDSHIMLAEGLVFSEKPSAQASFPGGVTISRQYDHLNAVHFQTPPQWVRLPCPGQVMYGGFEVTCQIARKIINTDRIFTVRVQGPVILRPRQPGDEITLSGGTKSLKKLFIDRKIPLSQRPHLPVVCDQIGILGVYSLGVHQKRAANALPAVTISFEK